MVWLCRFDDQVTIYHWKGGTGRVADCVRIYWNFRAMALRGSWNFADDSVLEIL